MLRTRFILGLTVFVVLLVGLGGFALVLLSRVAGRVDATVTGNYRSILVAQTMRLELGTIDREIWGSEQDPGAAAASVNTNLNSFEENLAILTNDTATAEEQALFTTLTTNFHSLKKSVIAFRAAEEPAARRDVYQLQLFPMVKAMDLCLQEIREINNAAIIATPGRIQEISRNIIHLLMLSLVLLLLVSGYVFYRIGRSIVEPIEALTDATRALGEGRWEKPLPVASSDELGELAQSFNTMAAQLQEYRRITTDEIVRLHRTMENTLASFPDPIFVLDRSGRIELRNPAAKSLARKTGFEDGLPEPLREITDRALASNKNFLPHSFAEGLSFRYAKVDKFFLPRVLIMRDKDQQLFGVAVVLYDVTRFRLLDAAKTNLVATVSHELKTPLTGLRMALHLVTEKTVGELLPRQEELLQAAREDAEKLLRILNDLLDLAKLDAGNASLHREAVPPADLVRATVNRFADNAADQKVELTGSVSADLPPVMVDPQRIHHVFSNLISNALKHTPAGGKVSVSAALTDNDCVEFTVTDTGPGIPEEYQGRIFDRFFRVPRQEKTGAGLGLSIAREIAVAHGGRIGVRSTPGKGSTFFVLLPARESSDQRIASESPNVDS